MDWKTLYQQRTMTAQEAVAHIHSGDRVVVQHACAEPTYLIDAMVAKGFLAGRSSTIFGPQEALTYEELVTILSAVSSWACMDGYALADRSIPANQQAAYAGLSDWAQAPAWRLSTLGVELDLSDPQAPATRDQAAHLICQFLRAAGLLWNV